MLPHHEGKRLTRDGMLQILRRLDDQLMGIQRKVCLYAIGGTVLVLENIRRISKDVDFIVSRRDFTALSGHVADLEWKDSVQIDLFPDGDMPDYQYRDYFIHAKKAPFDFTNLELFYIDKADWLLTKVIASRDTDIEDIGRFVRSSNVVSLDELRRRYERIVPAKGKEEVIKGRFETFVEKFYGKK